MLYEPRPAGVSESIALILVKAKNASDPLLVDWDQAGSSIVKLNTSRTGLLQGWCNSSSTAIDFIGWRVPVWTL